MNKLRDNTGSILMVLLVGFLVLWLVQDTNVASVMGNTSRNVAVVNGDPVPIEEYNRAVDQQLEQYQAQTGEPMPPQMVDITRQRVFDALVEDRLSKQEMDRLGISVSDDEVYDMIMGERPHPIINAYFSDGQGGVNRTLLQNFVQAPEAKEDLLQLEEYLRTERRREKLANLIASSVRVTEQDVVDEYNRRNRTASVQYVALPYARIPDDSIQVSESDLRRYYDEHKEDYARERTVKLNYVTISKNPSREDTLAAVNELSGLRQQFATAESDSAFLASNGSERPYSDQYFGAGDMDEELATAIFNDPQPGQIIGPVVVGTEAHLVKIQDVRPAETPSVRARHILFSAPEGDEAARAQALQEAQAVKQQIEAGASFEAMALQHSDDGTKAQGGDLGWFGRGRMVKPFEDAAFSAPIGTVVGPVATQFGYHLIEVTARGNQEVRIADLVTRVRTDVATLRSIQEKLDDLQYFASESGGFSEEAQKQGLEVQTVSVEEDQQFIPGLGNSRALLNFVSSADEEEISPVIELNDQFLVAEAVEVFKAGARPFDEVKSEIEPQARMERKKEIQRQRMEQALQGGGFEGLAQRLGQQLQTVPDVSLQTPIVPGLGREPKFAGTALGLNEGGTSRVVEGENAVFVLRTTDIKEPAPLNPQLKTDLTTQLRDSRQQALMRQWLTALRDKADVEDNRRLFEQ